MMMSMGLGVVLAVGLRAVRPLAASPAALAITGMVFGLVVWAVMQYGIWPAIDAGAAPKFTPWVFALGHLMYGAATALLVGTSLVRHRHPVPHLHGTPA